MASSGNCCKIRLAARELGVALTLRNHGLHDGATRRPEFLARNPNGRVPLLELDDGRYSIADIALYGDTHCAADGGFELSANPAANGRAAVGSGRLRP